MQGVRDDGVLPVSAGEREHLTLIRALAEGGSLLRAAAERLRISVRLKRLFAGVASRRGHGASEPNGADGSPHDFARACKSDAKSANTALSATSFNIQTIGACDATTRLSAVLDRTAVGEAFEITKHDRPVTRLTPAEGIRHKKAAADVLARLLAMRGTVGAITAAELKAMVHKGHRY